MGKKDIYYVPLEIVRKAPNPQPVVNGDMATLVAIVVVVDGGHGDVAV